MHCLLLEQVYNSYSIVLKYGIRELYYKYLFELYSCCLYL